MKSLKRKNEPNVYSISVGNENITEAIIKAKNTVNYFWTSLNNPKSTQTFFSARVLIVENKISEHLWITDIEIDNENIYGYISNQPVHLKNVKADSKIGVNKDLLTDWMIIEDHFLIGGYSIRAIRNMLTSEKEVFDFDKKLGFKIDDGIDYFIEDLSTPEGAILSLENAYTNNDINKALSCKDFFLEAELLLQKSKMDYENRQLVSETSELLKLTFIAWIEKNGFPSFKDVKHSFPCKQKISDTLVLVTEICHYPNNLSNKQNIYVGKVNDKWKVLNIQE